MKVRHLAGKTAAPVSLVNMTKLVTAHYMETLDRHN
jgi:hypothetical protein